MRKSTTQIPQFKHLNSTHIYSARIILQDIASPNYAKYLFIPESGICTNVCGWVSPDFRVQDELYELLKLSFTSWPQSSGSTAFPIFDPEDKIHKTAFKQYATSNLPKWAGNQLVLRQSLAAHCAKYLARYDYVQFLTRFIEIHVPAHTERRRAKVFNLHTFADGISLYLCNVLYSLSSDETEHPANIARLQKTITQKIQQQRQQQPTSLDKYFSDSPNVTLNPIFGRGDIGAANRIKWLKQIRASNIAHLTRSN